MVAPAAEMAQAVSLSEQLRFHCQDVLVAELPPTALIWMNDDSFPREALRDMRRELFEKTEDVVLVSYRVGSDLEPFRDSAKRWRGLYKLISL